MNDAAFWRFVADSAKGTPLLLLYITGFVLAVVSRKRLGAAAMMAMIAFSLFLGESAIGTVERAWNYMWLKDFTFWSAHVPMTIFAIVRTLLYGAAFAFLLYAIAKRNRSTTEVT